MAFGDLKKLPFFFLCFIVAFSWAKKQKRKNNERMGERTKETRAGRWSRFSTAFAYTQTHNTQGIVKAPLQNRARVLQAGRKASPWARGKAAPFQRKGSRPGNAGRSESSASAPKACFAPGAQSPLPFTPSPKWERGAMQPSGTFARLARGKRGPGGGPLWRPLRGCLPAPVQARHDAGPAGTSPDPPAASPGRSGAAPGD